MMKNLLKPHVLLALMMTLATGAAVAGDPACAFYPKQSGLIKDYTSPPAADKANGLDLIDKLTPDEALGSAAVAKSLDGVELVREGKDTWVIRTARTQYASVQGLLGVAPRWKQDYHRALSTVLSDSLKRGVAFSVTSNGSCN